MSMRYQAGIVLPGYNALKVANAPTIGTATGASATSISVPFTAPACTGGGAISSYRAYAACGVLANTGASSPIVVSGLTTGSSYTFKVVATNAYGPSYPSAASNSATTWTVPGAPTIGTASIASGSTTASVPFTAPASNGGSTITTYTATSSPGSLTGTLSQAGSGTVSVSGLSVGTAYTFTVTATNAVGTGPASAASNSITPTAVVGQQAYTSFGTYSWVAPTGVTSVSVVAVGPGQSGGYGGGGGLGYKNNYAVTSGSSYTVRVGNIGCSSYFVSTGVVRGGAGSSGTGGTYTGDGGGNGGNATYAAQAGGGAGGYSGTGGASATCSRLTGSSGSGGGGGGGGGGSGCPCYWGGAGGGGVGLLGQGSSGSGGAGATSGTSNNATGGCGGSGGASGSLTFGGAYGGGGGGSGSFGGGAVRIIWPGSTRSFPSTNTGDL